MRTPTLVVAALLLGSATSSGAAQHFSRLSSPVPAWADSALTAAGTFTHYDVPSRLSLECGWGDFDGDGFSDFALVVVDGGRRRGLAIVHFLDRSVHIVGAGESVGNGSDALPADWGIETLNGQRDAIFAVYRDASGWIAWTGQRYVWVQASE